jgi:hypothetical protein
MNGPALFAATPLATITPLIQSILALDLFNEPELAKALF